MSWLQDSADRAEGDDALRDALATRPVPAIGPRADTRQVSALQLLPFLPILITIMGMIPGGWNSTTLVGGVVVTAVIQFLLARGQTRGTLGNRGFVDRAPASLALVSSALYLYVRGRRCAWHDPRAGEAVQWAIIVTVVAIVFASIGTMFTWGVQGLIQTANDAS